VVDCPWVFIYKVIHRYLLSTTEEERGPTKRRIPCLFKNDAKELSLSLSLSLLWVLDSNVPGRMGVTESADLGEEGKKIWVRGAEEKRTGYSSLAGGQGGRTRAREHNPEELYQL
jgi:hypothetical protein